MKISVATVSSLILALSVGLSTATTPTVPTANEVTEDETIQKREAMANPDAEAWMRGHPRANWGLTGPQKREAMPEAAPDAEAWMRGHPRANWGLTGPKKREAAPEADANADAEAWMRGHPRANWGLTGPE